MRRRQARSQATAVSLLTAAETVLRRRAFGKASLVDIAREANVTTGAIYSSFSGKTDLLRALEVSVYGEVEAEAARILQEAPRELGAFFVRSCALWLPYTRRAAAGCDLSPSPPVMTPSSVREARRSIGGSSRHLSRRSPIERAADRSGWRSGQKLASSR